MINQNSELAAYFAEQAANRNDIMGALIPNVIEDSKNGRVSQDVISRLLKDRIVLLDGPVDDASAASIKAQMLFLDTNNPNNKDIKFYINSPGGVVTAGLSIFDTMQNIKCDVATFGIGQNCSMGSFLLAAGTKGKRYAMPNTRIMTHQPSGGAQGQQTDINIRAEEITRMRNQLERYYMYFMGMNTDKPPMETEYGRGLFERDTFFNALAGVKLGHVDKIYQPKNPTEQQKDFFDLQMKIMQEEIDSNPHISRMIAIREEYLASKAPKPANDQAAKPQP